MALGSATTIGVSATDSGWDTPPGVVTRIPVVDGAARTAKILLVDEHPIFRDGLRQGLAGHRHLSVVGEAATGSAALMLTEGLAPDLLIMEAQLPDISGIAVARELRNSRRLVKIILMSSVASRTLVDEALQAGADGFIWKRAMAGDLARAVEMALAGQLYLSPELSAGILQDYRSGLINGTDSAKPLLSKRDKQLIRLVAEGHRNKEIAGELAISPKSVEAYRSRLMKKLGYHGPAELVRHAIREGIVTA